ncbi:MAG TPA: acyl-CoA reductase [Labilithrix sp.]|nr:acyl-CoA reductase [Labilithrix sp.]
MSWIHDRIDATGLESEAARVEGAASNTAARPTADLSALFDAFATKLATPAFADVEGIAFLATWLRRKSLESTVRASLGGREAALDGFVADGSRKLRAAPRGIVAQWIAGNIPTLAVFSFVLSALVKNVNLVRVPKESLAVVRRMLAAFEETSITDASGQALSGRDILEGASFFYFPGEDRSLHAALSLRADARVVWGGQETLATVLALPRHEHCEDIVFGPKFSLGLIDTGGRERVVGQSDEGLAIARSLVRDVLLFDQAACSSPHILYVEGTLEDARAFGRALAGELAKQTKRNPKRGIAEGTAAAILRLRTDYGLAEDRDVFASSAVDYTVLVDADGPVLSEGVQSRTLFVRAVPSLRDVVPVVTPQVQTIGLLVDDAGLAADLAERLAQRGVSRLVRFGLMNVYDQPWDGLFACDRFVRWISWT